MSVGVKTFRGKRLKEARLARGLYKNALADMIGVSGWAVTRYEEDQDKPQFDKVVSIAASLNFPVEFFLKPEWGEPLPLIFWRSRASESKYVREMTEQRMIWLCETFHRLEEDVDFPKFHLPELDLPADFRSYTSETVEKAAEAVRKEWKLNDRPIQDVILSLENAGIPVVNLEIQSDKQDGFCFKSESLNRVFAGINTNNVSSARARYDAAHELGHALLHQRVTPAQVKEPAAHKAMEQQAHRFAGAFIFPKAAFIEEVYTPSLDYFCSLKKRWGLSIASMVYRAHDLGLIDEEEKTTLYRNMTRRRWRGPLQEPFDDRSSMPLEQPRMLRRAIDAIVAEGDCAPVDLVFQLALPHRELEQLIGVHPGFFEGRQDDLMTLSRKGGLKTADVDTGNVIEFTRHRQR